MQHHKYYIEYSEVDSEEILSRTAKFHLCPFNLLSFLKKLSSSETVVRTVVFLQDLTTKEVLVDRYNT